MSSANRVVGPVRVLLQDAFEGLRHVVVATVDQARLGAQLEVLNSAIAVAFAVGNDGRDAQTGTNARESCRTVVLRGGRDPPRTPRLGRSRGRRSQYNPPYSRDSCLCGVRTWNRKNLRYSTLEDGS